MVSHKKWDDELNIMKRPTVCLELNNKYYVVVYLLRLKWRNPQNNPTHRIDEKVPRFHNLLISCTFRWKLQMETDQSVSRIPYFQYISKQTWTSESAAMKRQVSNTAS